jgi:hypothetical protein
MTTRRMMIAVAVVAVILGGIIGMTELDRRADLFRKEAEYHRRREQYLETQAAYLEVLAGESWKAPGLLPALEQEGRESRGRAIAMELEASFGPPSRARLKPSASEARRDAIRGARAYRRASRYHARERERYERAAMDPWSSIEPDPPEP